MIYHILAVGDVVGESGLDHLARNLRPLKQFRGIHFAVVNGENAAGTGDRKSTRLNSSHQQ